MLRPQTLSESPEACITSIVCTAGLVADKFRSRARERENRSADPRPRVSPGVNSFRRAAILARGRSCSRLSMHIGISIGVEVAERIPARNLDEYICLNSRLIRPGILFGSFYFISGREFFSDGG